MENILSPDIFAAHFSNFSPHPIRYRGVRYATAEHAYHCQRHEDRAIIEIIQNAKNPEEAWEISQKYKSRQSPDFDQRKIEIMEDIFRAKLSQCPDVKQALLDSGDLVLVKAHPLDYFWGAGADDTGRNEMGKLWMKLRKELQSE